jgi:hypothetical protein
MISVMLEDKIIFLNKQNIIGVFPSNEIFN